MRTAISFALILALLLAASVEPSSISPSNLRSLSAAFGILGLPFVVLYAVHSIDRNAPAAKVAIALALLFMAIDLPMFLGAGMAAPVVGVFQLLVALVLGLVAWLVRRAP